MTRLGLLGLLLSSSSIQAMDILDDRKTIPVKFAVIGDFGNDGSDAQKVPDMVKRWEPDFIITTGDNNYNRATS